MKAVDIEDNTQNLTPKKKLTQARLPFKAISESATVTESALSRKRKLTSEDQKIESKIGRLSKENEITVGDDSIVISDDENNDEKILQLDDKPMNPLVKIIDSARKKKFQKSNLKKRRSSRIARSSAATSPKCNGAVEGKIEKMDVDESEETACIVNTEASFSLENEKQVVNKVMDEKHTEIIILDDESNSKTDMSKHLPEVQPSAEPPKTPVTTPKRLRSTTNKSASSDLDNTSDSKLDKSSTNSPASTPKSSEENSNTKLTPKQLQKRQEAAKKREERDKKKQEEKDEKARIKQEKEDQKKKEREEKEEQKRKEREEKEKQKELEKKLREEKEELKRKEKEEKEEQRRKEKEEKEDQRRKEKEAKEEEKRKKQEALDLEKQEQELKKKKAAEAFVNFFVPKQKVDKDTPSTGPISKNSVLSSFTIKSDMRLAPTVRSQLDNERRENLEKLIENQNEDTLYLKCLKEGFLTPGCCGKTWPLDDKNDDDVILVEDDLPSLEGVGEVISSESAVREKLRPKLFSFQENRRPPYWGTWRKKSQHIKPRKPFGKDEKVLDYEVDSDEEWEDEGEGESVDDDGSDEEAEGDEYEVDNEFFVPHGYLSDEEATMDGDDVLSLSPEAQKAKLKHLEDEFESEMKKPTEKLKPRLYGLLWATKDGGKPANCVDALWNYFDKLSMIIDDNTSLLQPVQENEEIEKKKVRKKRSLPEGEQSSPNGEKKKKQKEDTKKPQKNQNDTLKKQPGINNFLKKLKGT